MSFASSATHEGQAPRSAFLPQEQWLWKLCEHPRVPKVSKAKCTSVAGSPVFPFPFWTPFIAERAALGGMEWKTASKRANSKRTSWKESSDHVCTIWPCLCCSYPKSCQRVTTGVWAMLWQIHSYGTHLTTMCPTHDPSRHQGLPVLLLWGLMG